MLFPVAQGWHGLEKALEYLFMLADEAIEQGVNIFILSDRGVSREMAPIPALLATAGLHHHLIRRETRTQCALVVESGEPREVHHFALLIGYGATAINPYMAYETIYDMIDQGLVTDIDLREGQVPTTSRPASRASSRSARRWASAPCRATAARRFSRRWG